MQRKMCGEITPHHQLILVTLSSAAVIKEVRAHKNFQSLLGSMSILHILYTAHDLHILGSCNFCLFLYAFYAGTFL